MRGLIVRGLLWAALFWAALAPIAVAPAGAAGALTYLAHPADTSAGHPPLLILLHGSGADERDMIGLWPQLPRRFVVVSPRAPFRDVGGGYRWYRKGSTGASDIAVSRGIIDLVADQAVARFDADPQAVFVAGFSQGGVMAYEAALAEPRRFRGAAVLSGALFPSARAALAAPGQRAPFFIAHGTADARIPFGSATAARAALVAAGVPVAFHAYKGMGHGTGDAEVADLAAWLSEQLDAPR